MSKKDRLSGNEAVAVAIRQIDPDVFPAFPITPSTEIPQYVSLFKANGEMTTEFVAVESEHSAMSACIGAQAAGVRAMTATSSCGMALMYEMLYVAASLRMPIVLSAVNRALTGPININNDHSDSMGARDSGFIQIYSENAQEVYDNTLMANRIAEDTDVMLPIMVCQDGFITSHAVENIVIEDDDKVKAFVGEWKTDKSLLNPKEALGVGTYGTAQYYMEIKKQQHEAMRRAKKVIEKVSADFAKEFGRSYDLIEEYKMDDAEQAVILIGSSAGTGKKAVEDLRAQGKKVGLIKIRSFRPFPEQEIVAALKKSTKAVGIMDKSDGFSGVGGPLGAEIKSAMLDYDAKDIKAINYIYGLGGRDVRVCDFYEIFEELEKMTKGEDAPTTRYLGVRE